MGSVRAITNASGSITQTYQTDEFGVPVLTQGTVSQPFRYTGEQKDPESGLVFLRARYYWPSLGRFITRDSYFGLTPSPLTLDRYAYAADDPVLFADHISPIIMEWRYPES